MYLIQTLLPLRDADGEPFPRAYYEQVVRKLTDTFGGITAYTRSPAEGRWQSGGREEHDDVIVLETMTATLDRAWWRELRIMLEKEFGQDEIVIRAMPIERL